MTVTLSNDALEAAANVAVLWKKKICGPCKDYWYAKNRIEYHPWDVPDVTKGGDPAIAAAWTDEISGHEALEALEVICPGWRQLIDSGRGQLAADRFRKAMT